MGLSYSKANDESTSSLKLQAQIVMTFGGSYKDWNLWKSRTECALNGSGLIKFCLIKTMQKQMNRKTRLCTTSYP